MSRAPPRQSLPAKAVSAGTREAAAEPAAESSVPPPVPAVAPHLLYPRGVRITPNDYSIGPLQDLLIEAEPENAVTRTLVMFLRALAEGTIEPRQWRPTGCGASGAHCSST